MTFPTSAPSPSGGRVRLYLAILLVFGGLCVYGALGVWLGVAQAVDGPRVPGTVRDVQCNGRHSACGGIFTSGDGQTRSLHVTVSGTRRSASQPQPATLVRKIDNGLNGAIQSNDTAYLHGVNIDIVGSIVIGVLLSLLGLAIVVPFLLIGLLLALGKRPRGRGLPR